MIRVRVALVLLEHSHCLMTQVSGFLVITDMTVFQTAKQGYEGEVDCEHSCFKDVKKKEFPRVGQWP